MKESLAQVFCIYRLPKTPEETPSVTPTTSPPPIVEYPGKWPRPIVRYALIRGTQDIPDQHEIAVGVNLVLQSFADEIPIKYIKVGLTENPDLTYEWVKASDDPIFSTDPTGIMAYSGFPDATGTAIHIRLNDDFQWSFSGTNFQFNPLNTLGHETCHFMGLVHVPDCPKCLVYTFYNGVIDFDPLDISRLVAKYGKRTWSTGAYLRIYTAVYNAKRRLK